ncbi:MAG: hypothetical protein ACOX5A_09210 [Aminivibrio sp.]
MDTGTPPVISSSGGQVLRGQGKKGAALPAQLVDTGAGAAFLQGWDGGGSGERWGVKVKRYCERG